MIVSCNTHWKLEIGILHFLLKSPLFQDISDISPVFIRCFNFYPKSYSIRLRTLDLPDAGWVPQKK